MTLLVSIIVAVLFSGGFYLLLKRSMWESLLGVALMSHATNVLLIAMSGWDNESKPPILNSEASHGEGAHHLESLLTTYADPLPQALILTAIVIGFGLISFLMVMVARCYTTNHAIDVGELPDEELEP